MNDTVTVEVATVEGKDIKAEMDLSLSESKGALAVASENTSPADQKRVKELILVAPIQLSTSALKRRVV